MKGIGLQLYSLRRIIADDIPGTLERVAAAGYDAVEAAGYYEVGAKPLGEMVRAAGMRVAATHIGLDLLRHEFDTHVRLAQEATAEALICPIIPHEETETAKQFASIAAEFNSWAETVTDAGMRFLYHLHGGEFAPLADGGGRTGFQILLEETNPALVGFELDTYWVEHAGQESVALYTAHKDRIPYLHLKDYDAVETFADVPVGTGRVNTKELLTHALAAGVEWLVVEQEQFDRPEMQSVGESCTNIRSMVQSL